MKIEFSAPKICYGQNFSELKESQFEIMLGTLHQRLESMGIIVTLETLRHARVMAIHYSKNMVLKSGSYCRMVINELAKLDLNKRLDLMQTDYKNGGQAVKYHSSYYGIIFYDKIKDLEQAGLHGDKRTIEREYGSEQLDLLEAVPPRQEVLRLEVRLSSRKMNSLLPKLGITAPLQFDILFKQPIAQQVLLHYWHEITEGLYMLSFDGESIENLIAHIQNMYPRINGKALCELIGMIKASNELGIRGARLAMHLTSSQWYRMKRKLKEISASKKNHRLLALNQIKRELELFVPLKWPSFKDAAASATGKP